MIAQQNDVESIMIKISWEWKFNDLWNALNMKKNKHLWYKADKIDNEIHLYVMSTTNLLILFCVWIEVKRVKRSQFDAVWMMLERCVIRKVVVQSFHPCDNIFPNSHNRSTKKINDMSMSVRDEKILKLVKKTTQMKSLRVVTTSDWRICDSSTASISKRLHHIDNVVE